MTLNIYMPLHKLALWNNQKAQLQDSDRSSFIAHQPHTSCSFALASHFWLHKWRNLQHAWWVHVLFMFFFHNPVFPHLVHWQQSCCAAHIYIKKKESRGVEDSAVRVWIKWMDDFVMHRMAPRRSESRKSGLDTHWNCLMLSLQPQYSTPYWERWANILTRT